jgi:methionine sulfoxide reductase heme-binding subunit
VTASYKGVQWNRHKRLYDLAVVGGVIAIVGAWVVGSKVAHTGVNSVGDEVLVLRGLAIAAIVLLHIVLCIGPLARLSPRFAPLLYNRRHLGVVTFLVALAHAIIATGYYGGFGVTDPVSAVLLDSGDLRSISGFRFEVLGLLALAILFVLAATSHDFWLANLGARVWKWLHMSVYVAYAAVVLHVALGALQREPGPLGLLLLGAGVTIVSTLHIIAGRRARARDAQAASPQAWIDAGAVDDIPQDRARIVCVKGHEPIAVFRHAGGVSAITNVCAHQGGPLGEGKVVDGCVTCPWHGYQYLPASGQSPPPYTEKIATYRVRIDAGRVLVDPAAQAPGTPVEPAKPGAPAKPDPDEFYVGYLPTPRAQLRFVRAAVPALLVLCAAVAGLIGVTQRDPGPAVWSLELSPAIEGVVREHPYPMLELDTPEGPRLAMLVEVGKIGAQARVRGLDGRRVRVSGWPLDRDGRRIIELAPDPSGLVAIEDQPQVVPARAMVAGETVELRGEIVDYKCFLGAMKPGDGKGHKACATLCVRGGIPPVLVTIEPDGSRGYHLLCGPDGVSPMPGSILPLIGEPVIVQGTRFGATDLAVLGVLESGVRRAR